MAPDYYSADRDYDEKVDIWAFGLSVLEMVTLEVPYNECDSLFVSIFKHVSRVLDLSTLWRDFC